MFVFAGASYFFSRFYRVWLDAPEPWEGWVTEYWLYAGTVGLVLGLWGALDSAPFNHVGFWSGPGTDVPILAGQSRP